MRANAAIAIDHKTVALGPVEIGEPGEWDLLVKLECSAISVGTESYILSTTQVGKPRVIGYAPVGRVVRAGASTKFAVGDRVTYFAPRPPLDTPQLCGGHQSPAIINVNHTQRDLLAPNAYCVKVPENVSSEHAAFAGISAVSYLGAHLANPAPGEKVAIVGQGIIGLFATQHFALRGAQVMAIDIDARRLKLAGECGADFCVQPGEDLGAAIRRVWPGGADILVDTTANHRVVEASIAGLRHEGKYVFLGYYKGADFNLGALHGVVFHGLFPWTLRGNLVVASLQLMTMGALKIAPLISHRFPASEVTAAFELAGKRPAKYTGILLDWR